MGTDTSVYRETDPEGLSRIENDSEKEFTSTMKVLYTMQSSTIPRESMLAND